MKERYEGIDGLKAYAILGIALMHILANGNFGLNGFVFQKLIPSFTNLVFLFMMVSGFGMCCGYYQKFKDQKIGVSWTLAVIFVFYLLFPFFCFLLENKQRVWLAFACAVIYNFVCSTYFFDENHIANQVIVNFSARTNILYCAVYFIAGGLIFLYRKELAEFASKYKVIAGAILLIATVAYFALGGSTLTMMFFCVVALIYTLGCRTGVLVNPIAKFLGGICFEIYLCHMVIYRVLEKVHLVHLFGNGLADIYLHSCGGYLRISCVLGMCQVVLK